MLGSKNHPWTTGLDSPMRQNKTKTPGNGRADPVKLKFDASGVRDMMQATDLNAESPVLEGCITVTVKEDKSPEYFQVWVPVELTVKIPCAPGTFSSQDGTTPCIMCGTNTYQDQAGQRSCKTCSSLKEREISTTVGTMGATTPDACVVCPENAVCRIELPDFIEKGVVLKPFFLGPDYSRVNESTARLTTAVAAEAAAEAMRRADVLASSLLDENATTGGNVTTMPSPPPPTSSASLSEGDVAAQAWESVASGETDFYQMNGRVRVYMMAKNGYKRETRCNEPMTLGFSRIKFELCDRPLSCLGAATRFDGQTFGDKGERAGNGSALVRVFPKSSDAASTEEFVVNVIDQQDYDVFMLAVSNDELEEDDILKNYNFREGCAPGYTGARCLACAEGRSRYFGRATACEKCQGAVTIIMGSVVAILVGTIATLLCIRWALLNHGTKGERSILVEITKISYNHLQLLSIMVSFPIVWPQALYDLFSGMSALSAAGGQILSPDCLLNGGASMVASGLGSKVYVQAIAVGMVPIVSIIGIILFWRMYSCVAACCYSTRRCCYVHCGSKCKAVCIRRKAAGGGAGSGAGSRVSTKIRAAGKGRAKIVALTSKQMRQSGRVAIVMLLFVTHLMLVQTALDFFVCRRVLYKPTPAETDRFENSIFSQSIAFSQTFVNNNAGFTKETIENTTATCTSTNIYIIFSVANIKYLH